MISKRIQVSDELDRYMQNLAALALEEISQSRKAAVTKFVNEQGRQIAVHSDLYSSMQEILGQQGYNSNRVHQYLFQEREL
jgi:hypothetical protein